MPKNTTWVTGKVGLKMRYDKMMLGNSDYFLDDRFLGMRLNVSENVTFGHEMFKNKPTFYQTENENYIKVMILMKGSNHNKSPLMSTLDYMGPFSVKRNSVFASLELLLASVNPNSYNLERLTTQEKLFYDEYLFDHRKSWFEDEELI